jgi:hypothetical protein
MRFLTLFLFLFATACGGSSSKPSPAHPKKTVASKTTKATKGKKIKKLRPPPPPEEPAFEPPPLAEMTDLGALKAKKLGKPVAALKKLCPPAKRGKPAKVACMCPAMGEATNEDSWQDESKSCGTAPEGLEDPFLNVQLLALQKTKPARRHSDEGDSISVEFELMLQTKKGIATAKLGNAMMEPGVGYPVAMTLVSRSFVELGAGKSLLTVFNQETSTFEKGTGDDGTDVRKKASTGWIVVCGVDGAKKVACTDLVSLGAARKEGYELKPVVEEGKLYLVETAADTSVDTKKLSGKYALELR